MKTGIATVPLDYGHCPRWLFERMRRLARSITLIIVEEFGTEEFLKRLSDPIWFQSFGCVLGFDWNSSGLGVTTLGALKSGIFDIQDRLGIYVCGGKKTSRQTPQEIDAYGRSRGFDFAPNLIYASRIVAKVDSSLVQDGFSIYQHNFIFNQLGQWVVVQQGMNIDVQKARRYHWLSEKISNFLEEPHAGIISQRNEKIIPLNLIAKESKKNKEISFKIIKEEPHNFLRYIEKINAKNLPIKKTNKDSFKEHNNLFWQRRLPGFCEIELENVEFQYHSVLKEKFDLKRLKKITEKAHFLQPESFEKLLMIEGIGPKTIRALSLVAEIIYGKKPSYQDPARYTFSVGGKDGTPYFVERNTYDSLLGVIEKGIEKAKISLKEKDEAKIRLFKAYGKNK